MSLSVVPSSVKMVFVYGTLKKGFGNHSVMVRSNGRFIGHHVTEAQYTMFSLGAYPAVVHDGMGRISGEVYEVDTLGPLDRLEGYPGFYDRMLIDTDFGKAWMYVLRRREEYMDAQHGQYIIPDGVWRKGETIEAYL